jgi:hypothetical protein
MHSATWHPTPLRTRAGFAAAIVVTVISAGTVLAGCSGGTSTPSGPTTSSALPRPTPSPGRSTGAGASSTSSPAHPASPSTGLTGTTSTTSTTSTTGTTGTTGTAHCGSRQLRYRIERSEGAAGTINTAIRVTNTGPGTCWTYGYPGLQILDAARRPLPTVVLRGAASPFQGPLPPQLHDVPHRVTLPAGGWGWFDLAYSDVDQAAVCPAGPPAGTWLAVIAPDTTTPTVISLSTHICGGRLGVSPILPTSTLTW